jgi:hypothetical protein
MGRGSSVVLARVVSFGVPSCYLGSAAVYAVQDLRCQLATVRWLPRERMLTECAALGRLSADAGRDAP